MIITFSTPDGRTLAAGTGRLKILAVRGLESPPQTLYWTQGIRKETAVSFTVRFPPRQIQMELALDVRSLSEGQRQQEALNISRVLDGSEGRLTVLRDTESRYLEARPTREAVFHPRLPHEEWQKISISFTGTTSCFLDEHEETVDLKFYATLTEFFEDGIEIPSDGREFATILHSGARTVEIENPGSVDTPIFIRFTGPIVNPFIVNRTSGEILKVTRTIPEGGWIEINTAEGLRSITLHSSKEMENGMHWLDLESRFWSLKPGKNMIELGDESPGEGSEARFSYRSRHINA